MAQIDIRVKDVALDDVLDFFCVILQAPYLPFLDPPDNLIPNPLSKEQHVEERLELHYGAMYNRYKLNALVAAYEQTIPFDDSIGTEI